MYLARDSVPPETINQALAAFLIEVVQFDCEQGMITGCLYPACKSLGDQPICEAACTGRIILI